MLNLSPANALPDTIILRVGNSSKVIFYGKSPQDLKKLEQLDLNLILKDLNQKQSMTDTSQLQHIVLENSAFESKNAALPEGSKYWKNTFLNLHVGTGYHVNRYTFFQPPTSVLNHPTARLSSDIVMENLLTTSLSVAHDAKLLDRDRYAFALRYGVGLGLNIQRYLHWNSMQSVPSEDIAEMKERGEAVLQAEKITPLQSDFNAFQTYIQLSPKISLKNANGLSTFYLDLGIRLNYNRLFPNASPSIYSSSILINNPSGPTAAGEGPVIRGGGYEVTARKHTFAPSYVAEIGYKWIGVFVVYYPDYVPLTTRLVEGPDRAGAGFTNNKKGNLGYVSFGLRLGR